MRHAAPATQVPYKLYGTVTVQPAGKNPIAKSHFPFALYFLFESFCEMVKAVL